MLVTLQIVLAKDQVNYLRSIIVKEIPNQIKSQCINQFLSDVACTQSVFFMIILKYVQSVDIHTVYNDEQTMC